MIELVHVPGQTPPDADELAGLIPTHITTQAQLNQWEETNIVSGQRWAMRSYKRREVLDPAFARDLHRRMFGDTWTWAGTFRNSDKNIGVPWQHVATRVHQLMSTAQAELEQQIHAMDEHAIRFHHKLVWIHPFPNGNGRHARMMADLLVMRQGGKRFSWGAAADLVQPGEARQKYIAALQAADGGDFAALLQFARS